MLVFAHVHLGNYRKEVPFVQELLGTQRLNEDFADPNYAAILRVQQTLLMMQFGRVLFAAGEHERVEQMQREALRWFQREVTGRWSTAEPGQRTEGRPGGLGRAAGHSRNGPRMAHRLRGALPQG